MHFSTVLRYVRGAAGLDVDSHDAEDVTPLESEVVHPQ
jgi:hypothetical protein